MIYAVPLSITSPLPGNLGDIPICAEIDFAALLQTLAAGDRRLDPASVTVQDLTDGAAITVHLGEAFAHGDVGPVEFVIGDPTHTRYEIRFATLPAGAARPP
ncbi:MAG: hypothetical protein O2782_09220, partial [bacterium]|nr:hypothetical protein [bacterium]